MNDDLELSAALGSYDRPSAATCLPDSEGYLGRRIEADGSWTTYHVFTGAPARINRRLMLGLTKCEATATMVRRNADSGVK